MAGFKEEVIVVGGHSITICQWRRLSARRPLAVAWALELGGWNRAHPWPLKGRPRAGRGSSSRQSCLNQIKGACLGLNETVTKTATTFLWLAELDGRVVEIRVYTRIGSGREWLATRWRGRLRNPCGFWLAIMSAFGVVVHTSPEL